MDRYWSEVFFIEIWNDLLQIKDTDDKKTTQTYFIEKIENIVNNDLKRFLIYVIDEFLVGIFKNMWFNYFLESYFYRTCSGGKVFFDNLDFFIKTNNVEMIKLHLFAIKLGFKGNRENPLKDYDRYYKTLFKTKDFDYKVPFKKPEMNQKTISIFFIFLPIIILIIILNFADFIMLKYVSKGIINNVKEIIEDI